MNLQNGRWSERVQMKIQMAPWHMAHERLLDAVYAPIPANMSSLLSSLNENVTEESVPLLVLKLYLKDKVMRFIVANGGVPSSKDL